MIPVHIPEILEEDAQMVLDAVRQGEVSGAFGKYISQFEEQFAAYCGAQYGVATTSGTTALQLAVATLNISSGDEVILSTLTNIASCLAITHCNATPVCADSEPDTWNMDVSLVEKLITPKTKAIMPVHIYGHPVDMDPLLALAKKYNLAIIEDGAEAHGAEYKGKRTGSFGTLNCFSFYANKVITTGEGGMIVTNDAQLAESAKALRGLAFGKKQRFLHEDLGYNFRLTNIQAAMGVSQLKRIDSIVTRKRAIAHRYLKNLKNVPGIRLPVEKSWAKNVYWMFCIVLEPEFPLKREAFVSELKKKGVDTRDFFVPMHQQPPFLKKGLFKNIRLPVSEYLGSAGLYLPSSNNLTDSTIDEICNIIQEIAQSMPASK